MAPVDVRAAPGVLDLLRWYVRRSPSELAWPDWLPLAQICAEDPDSWLAAFQGLPEEEQYDLVARLAHPDAGPLADCVLQFLADHAPQLADDQTRMMVLDEAAALASRQLSHVQVIRDRVEALSQVIQTKQAWVTEELDLAQEELRLRETVAELRSQEFGDEAGRFRTIHELEGEILRYEARQRLLRRYDFEERSRVLGALQREVHDLDAKRRGLESEISSQTGARDELRRAVSEIEGQCREVTHELETAEAARQRGEGELSRLREGLQQTQRRGDQQREELSRLRAEAAGLERAALEAEARCREERSRLQELRAAAAGAGAAAIVRRIDELYRDLPEDRADEGYAAVNRR